MNAIQAGERVRVFLEEAVGRMTGIGAEQYGQQDPQRFETSTPQEILAGAREELLDLANYAAMAAIRVEQIMSRIDAATE